METRSHDAKNDVDLLNSFLQDELSAVETYQQCIEKIDQPQLASSLTELQRSHQKRATLLSHRVQELGGIPDTDSGTWGSFAKLVEGGASMMGDKTAISALEEGEDRGKNNYEKGTSELAPENQTFISSKILPEHQRSHDTLSRIKHTMH